MKKIRAAVVGYGNIGKYALEALETAPDFEVAGIVRRNGAENKPAELAQYEVVKDIRDLKDVDVAILATPTRSLSKDAAKSKEKASKYFNHDHTHTSLLGAQMNARSVAKGLRDIQSPLVKYLKAK